MGRYVVKVPDIGEGMTEAEIVAWHVAPGQVIREEDPLVDVMTDKATVELPAPVAGTVVERNAAIEDRPELVNEQPYGDGWLVVIEPSDTAAIEGLLDAAAYRALVDGS